MASPRLVTGANMRTPSEPGSTTSDCVASARPAELSTSDTRSAVSSPWVRVAAGLIGVAEPDERVAAEVRDEEGHIASVELVRKSLTEHIGG